MLRRLFSLGLIALALASACSAAEPGTDLQELRQKIDSLKQELEANEATRTEAADALKESEKAISDANRAFADLNKQQIESQLEIDKVNTDIARVNANIDANRIRLTKLLRARYRNGEHEALRLLLNKQDPTKLSRELQYYRYIAEAQHKLAVELDAELGKLNALSDELRAKHEELVRLANEKKQVRDSLRTQQAAKQKVLNKLSDQIGEQRKEIGKLQRDEQRLTQLVERLEKLSREREAKEARERQKQERARKLAEARQAKSPTPSPTPGKDKAAAHAEQSSGEKPEVPTRQNEALPDDSVDGHRFADLKGDLHLPARGDVIGKFGAARSEGMTWKGIFIKAGNGQPVKAVASGRVVFADWLRGFGNMIIVDHGSGYMSLYGTAETLLRKVGDPVKAGEDIATCGNSGGNAETGIYFELRHLGKPVDPLAWAK
ncbi:MAG: peptidoglycan DD-metalloendopeptidase family protein [Burkholderiales bacterium]|nr:peptidoglycan DD-metalloendopeptidase family protein [Burkholderiales bacterium]